jgi:glycerol-1-phosphatase
VGDRLDTDIEGADRAGMDSLLVLTGVSTPADVLAAPAHRRPAYIAADLSALSTAEELPRVPEWTDGAAMCGPWRATSGDDDRLMLAGDAPDGAEPVAALRALARAAWSNPEWTGIRPDGAAAERTLARLGLDRHTGWTVHKG